MCDAGTNAVPGWLATSGPPPQQSPTKLATISLWATLRWITATGLWTSKLPGGPPCVAGAAVAAACMPRASFTTLVAAHGLHALWQPHTKATGLFGAFHACATPLCPRFRSANSWKQRRYNSGTAGHGGCVSTAEISILRSHTAFLHRLAVSNVTARVKGLPGSNFPLEGCAHPTRAVFPPNVFMMGASIKCHQRRQTRGH